MAVWCKHVCTYTHIHTAFHCFITPFLCYFSFFHPKASSPRAARALTYRRKFAQNVTPHTYSIEEADCFVWTLNWFPLHYPVIGQLMLRVAREMEEDSSLWLQDLLSICCTHAHNAAALLHKHMLMHAGTYHHTRNYAENKFVFKPINMHMNKE